MVVLAFSCEKVFMMDISKKIEKIFQLFWSSFSLLFRVVFEFIPKLIVKTGGKWKKQRNFVCPGCNNHRVSTDKEHTRIVGECQYPHVATIEWKCPACDLRKPFKDKRHELLPGSCRFATTRADQTTRAQAVPRTGKHPRDPAIPASCRACRRPSHE